MWIESVFWVLVTVWWWIVVAVMGGGVLVVLGMLWKHREVMALVKAARAQAVKDAGA